MKKILTTVLISSMVLVGCGEPSEEEIALKQMELDHKVRMAEIEAQKEIARIEAGQVATRELEQAQVEYEQAGEQAYAQAYQAEMQQMYQQDGSGDLALGLLGGAVVGYMASELLDNGWSSGYDSYGRQTYYDNNHRPVSRSAYMSKQSTSKVSKSIPKKSLDAKLTRFKRKSAVFAEKAKRKAIVAKDKALVKAKPMLEKAKVKSKKALSVVKDKTKVGIQKAKPVVKKGMDKTKTVLNKAKQKTTPLATKAKKKTTSAWKKTKSSFSSKKKRR